MQYSIFFHASIPDGIIAQLFTLLYKTSTDFTDASVYADNGNEMLQSRYCCCNVFTVTIGE